MKFYSKCEVHTPKFIQLPFDSKNSLLNSKCQWITSYGAFGSSIDFLNDGEIG